MATVRITIDLETADAMRKAAQLKEAVDKFVSSPPGVKGIKGANFSNATSDFLSLNPGLLSLGGASNIKPPPIPKPNYASQNLLAGIISMASNPYLSARAFLSSGGFGGSGGVGGIFGGGAGGNMLPASIALTSVKVAAETLRRAFDELIDSVKRGSKLYQDAARVGRSVGATFQLQQALTSIGLSPQLADQLLLQAQFSRSGRSGGNFARPGQIGAASTTQIGFEDVMLGARNRPQQLGDLQQLVNLSNYAKKAWEDAAVDAQRAGENSQQLFKTTFEVSRLKREWSTLWETFAAELSKTLLPVVEGITAGLKFINSHSDFFRRVFNSGFSGLTGIPFDVLGKPSGSGDIFQAALSQLQRPSVNQFERMGFISAGGPGAQTSYLRQIAENTGKIVNIATTKLTSGSGASSSWVTQQMP
jgi:hypothetical protein